jgi:hypothetical protein
VQSKPFGLNKGRGEIKLESGPVQVLQVLHVFTTA